jgi:phosphate/sulfate permease
MEIFVSTAVFFGVAMLMWDCVEVGRNDAANIVNAVFGSRILRRRAAVWVAGVAVVLGATASTPVMETARKGIFEPGLLTVQMAVTVYISVYLVDTVLLYSYSAYGMPVSTTACLVFELVGASMGMYGLAAVDGNPLGAGIVHWPKVGRVVLEILLSILMSGTAGFLLQRVFRGAIRDKYQDRETILLHGPWIAGMMLTWLAYFLLLKGLKDILLIQRLREVTVDVYGSALALMVMWAVFTLAVHLVLTVSGQRGTRYLFHATAVLGMLSMAFAFGQNDLANCASPGLSALWLWYHSGESVQITSQVGISSWALFGCGLLIVLGMSTRHAQRVTRAEVNTGSQFDQVALYAPKWCQAVARWILWLRPKGEALVPPPALSDRGKKIHYDALRASVIMSVSASVIALASGKGLPVSTTYVAFAAVVATGLADRVMARGDADLKIGRAIWVITSWFLAALIAMGATAVVARTVYHLGIAGLAVALALNLTVRYFAKRRSDAQEERVHGRLAAAGGVDIDAIEESPQAGFTPGPGDPEAGQVG